MSVWDQAVDVLRESMMAYAVLFNGNDVPGFFGPVITGK